MPYSVNLESFDELSDEWERILPSCITNTIFLTPLWQRTWWMQFGSDAELCLLSFRQNKGLQGVAPLMLKEGVLSFLGDTDLFDYHDFVVPQGSEDDFYAALLDTLDSKVWQTIDLRSLPEKSPTLHHLSSVARERGYVVAVDVEDVTLGIKLPGSWEEYLAGLTKKDRHELRRKLRRLDQWGKSRQYSCEPNDVNASMEEFFRLMRASGSDKAEFLIPERERFFRAAAKELASREQLKLYFLELDGVNVASAICFDYGKASLLYNSGYDPAYSSLSIGLLNKALCLKDAIEEGKKLFDFLRGSEAYKSDLGGRPDNLYHMLIRRA
ncbi:MAG: GNAT family N-acetyltransferase [Chloroflexi bacterium]|nr:GNAT family N-acetyltransferase [Chloroflexota bacterium]